MAPTSIKKCLLRAHIPYQSNKLLPPFCDVLHTTMTMRLDCLTDILGIVCHVFNLDPFLRVMLVEVLRDIHVIYEVELYTSTHNDDS